MGGAFAFAVRGLELARANPRHVVLAGLVAGLLASSAGVAAVVVAAVVAGVIGGRGWAGPVAAAAVLAGAGAAETRIASLDAGQLAAMHGRRVQTRATLLEPVRERMSGLAVARVRLLEGPGAGEQAVLRMRRYAYAGPWPEVGEELRLAGVVLPLGLSDAYQRRRNAHAAIDATHVQRTGARRGGLAGVLDGLRRRAERALDAQLEPQDSALLRGMVLGEDDRLSASVREDFQRAGLMHILAASGQNVMLLVLLVLFAGAALGIGLRARLVLAAAVIALYVPVAGAGPSIQRAGVMGVAGLAATLAGHPSRRWYALGLAAAVTLLLNPRAAGEPGWQLSFAAVVALLIGAAPLRAAFGRRLPGPVAEAAAITVAATLGTAPLMALLFGQVSLASLPANLLAAPAIAPVMWLGMLAAAAAQLSPALAVPFTVLTAPLLVFIRWVAHVTASLPWAAVPVEVSPVAIVAGSVALMAAIALLVQPRRRPRIEWLVRPRRAHAAAAAAAACLAAALLVHTRADTGAPLVKGELRVSFLDVGQGDATLIQLDDVAVLVDTGPPDGPILQRLREARLHRLDALILTHAEADHEGAAPAVLRAHDTRMVVDGGAGWTSRVQRVLAAGPTRVVAPAAGQLLTIGGLRFRILWPPAPPPGWKPDGEPNNHAVVARLEVGRFSLLLTADAESDVTAALDLEPVDALKVAHHGSADPGLPALLERLRPRVAAIEVGRHNTYGHPTPSTLRALRAVVPTIVRTDRDGTVRLHVAGARMWLERV